MPVTTPKLKLPLVLEGTRLAVVEQESTDEVAQCVYAAVATELGQRVERPEYGLPDQLFRPGGADIAEIRATIERWEPRAEILTDDELVDLVHSVRVEVA